MITGSIILLVGIAIGYTMSFLRNPYSKPAKLIKKIVSKRAKIVEPDPVIDLGIENE